jgi:hypothetical protein
VNLNLGCGEYVAPGYLNIDLTHPGADLRHDITRGLPWVGAGETFDRIYAGHVLEHLGLPELPEILARWRNHPAVTPHTRLAVVGPDCDRADELHAAGKLDDEALRLIVDGGGRWVGDVHLWRSTGATTRAVLEAAGWSVTPLSLLELAALGWPIVCLTDWQFALLASPTGESS